MLACIPGGLVPQCTRFSEKTKQLTECLTDHPIIFCVLAFKLIMIWCRLLPVHLGLRSRVTFPFYGQIQTSSTISSCLLWFLTPIKCHSNASILSAMGTNRSQRVVDQANMVGGVIVRSHIQATAERTFVWHTTLKWKWRHWLYGLPSDVRWTLLQDWNT